MEILFVSSEVAPYSHRGPAADVVAALPKALRGLDHKVTVVSPLYDSIDPARHSLARRLSKIEVQLGDRKLSCELYDGRTAGGVDLLFIRHEEVFRGVEHLCPSGDADEEAALRAGLFTRAAVEVARTRDPAVGAIHAHDWIGALFALHARTSGELGETPIVLSIHDPSDHGVFDRMVAPALGLEEGLADSIAKDGEIRLLPAGFDRVDRVATSSTTWARELCTPEAGYGLHEALSGLGDQLVGIENGVDASLWNPTTDPKLPSRYDPMDLSGKARCKADVQRQLGLPVRHDVPVLGMLATDGEISGFDLFAKAAPRVLRNDCQIIAVYSGDAEAPLRGVLEELSERWPDRMQVRDDDGDLPSLVLGASDLLLVPSRREPTGFAHLWAHRYGVLPIAHRIGSLADAVVDCDAKLETGSGFLFDAATAEDLLAAIRRGMSAFHEREAFEALRGRVMRVDHSWDRSARLFERLYRGGPSL